MIVISRQRIVGEKIACVSVPRLCAKLSSVHLQLVIVSTGLRQNPVATYSLADALAAVPVSASAVSAVSE